MLGLAGCLGGGSDGGSGDGGSGSTGSTGTSSGDDELSDTLRFYSWGGSTQEALTKHLINPFQEEYDVTVEQSSFSSQDKMLANVRSNPAGSYDVIMPSLSGSYNAVKQDLVEPLRLDNIETWSNLLSAFQKYDPAGTGDKTYVAPLYYGTVGMVYNSDEVSGSPPFSWNLTWDSKYKNALTLEGFAFVRMFTTALAQGMDPNKMQGDTGSYEKGVQKVYDAMAEQHDLVKKYWTSGQEQTTLYSNGTAVLGDGWSGRILSMQKDGYENLKYTIPKEGAYGWSDTFAIAKGSKHRYTAEKFIQFAYRPEVMKKLSPVLGYPPATKATSSEIEDLPDYDPTGGDRLKFQNQKFKEEHQEEWNQTFEQIKLGQY
ncbi:PotD/PotF family extracellular solute-binding protein [Haloarcula nitratireducens]|uniref:ABC transporter substrate-binding protein n=1 Tax=Haloarcula nitratireducens TaxID=2487749 RepID=UPI002E27FE48|nr:PotD/PotF family extracellular solute-binding protein [Halomicroarcula nitratireducens]